MNDHALPFSPYKGLIPYSENDANFFFGRQRERDMIEANLIATRLTLLYGASGVGKSSVLRAGVVHHLRHLAAEDLANHGNPEFAVVIVNAWRDDPLTSLLNSVYTALQADLGPLHPAVASLAPPSAAAFVPTLQAWTTALDCDLLLILDQFEEYLFYHATEDGLGTLAMEFPRAVNHPDLRVNFLIAIREDALARLDRFKGRIPRLFENYLRIQHLDVAAARDAIEQPLLTYNRLMAPVQPVTIEPALVDEVLAQVQTNQVFVGESGRGAVSGAGGPARVETPYLQLVMSRLWAEEVQAGESVLRLATLQRLGGAERIVRTHLDTVISTLTPAEQDHAARIFHHLVTPSGTKIAHSVPDLAEYSGLTPAQLEPVLEKLSSSSMDALRPGAGTSRRRGAAAGRTRRGRAAPAPTAGRSRGPPGAGTPPSPEPAPDRAGPSRPAPAHGGPGGLCAQPVPDRDAGHCCGQGRRVAQHCGQRQPADADGPRVERAAGAVCRAVVPQSAGRRCPAPGADRLSHSCDSFGL